MGSGNLGLFGGFYPRSFLAEVLIRLESPLSSWSLVCIDSPMPGSMCQRERDTRSLRGNNGSPLHGFGLLLQSLCVSFSGAS